MDFRNTIDVLGLNYQGRLGDFATGKRRGVSGDSGGTGAVEVG